jgi:hypothetical protein
MFCPVCEAEYESGVSRCPDDDAELVSHLDPATSSDGSEARFVQLRHLGSPAEAEMVNDILRQNGIRSAVQAGGSDTLSPLLSTSEGSIILVDERDLDRAQELYSAFFADDSTPLTGSGDSDEENFEDEDQSEA